MTGETATLGDYGAGGPRSDSQIDKQEAAKEAAAGDWELLAAGTNTVGWHIPETRCTVLLKAKEERWRLERATKPVGTCDSLHEGLELAHRYMTDRPEGGSPWR
ncbi:hypothetical protein [Haloarcula marina]|uniref:hypothetical protein n=1 Tax=Haloarcula marina TaxID=2961574 RepID=UPI0020B830F3|nr:hypothetical protein [Halomicroarcula marina]